MNLCVKQFLLFLSYDTSQLNRYQVISLFLQTFASQNLRVGQLRPLCRGQFDTLSSPYDNRTRRTSFLIRCYRAQHILAWISRSSRALNIRQILRSRPRTSLLGMKSIRISNVAMSLIRVVLAGTLELPDDYWRVYKTRRKVLQFRSTA